MNANSRQASLACQKNSVQQRSIAAKYEKNSQENRGLENNTFDCRPNAMVTQFSCPKSSCLFVLWTARLVCLTHFIKKCAAHRGFASCSSPGHPAVFPAISHAN